MMSQSEHKKVPRLAPETIVSSIPQIFIKILNHLNLNSLKALRLVDLIRRDFATEEISRRNSTVIKLLFVRTKGQILKKNVCENAADDMGEFQLHSNSKRKLQEFLAILQNSSDFPCTKFELQDGQLSHPLVQQFFTSFGWKIRTLTLSGEFQGSQTDLHKLLHLQAINLESLFICHTICNMSWSEPKPAIHLPKLQTFGASEDDGSYVSRDFSPLPLEIIQGAPNLQRILSFIMPDFEDEFGHCPLENHLDKIKYLYVHTEFSDFNEIHRLASKSESEKPARLIKFDLQYSSGFDRPWLEPFEPIGQNWPQHWHFNHVNGRWISSYSREINKILQSSKDSLEDLVLSSCAYPSVDLPSFSRVKRLRIIQSLIDPFFQEDEPGPDVLINARADAIPEFVFPQALNLRETFPQLKTVILNLELRTESRWLDFFPNLHDNCGTAGRLETVQTLEVTKQVTTSLWTKIGQVFPNVQSLGVTSHCELKEALPEFSRLWGKTLENLTIKMKTGQSLDLIFSGITSPGIQSGHSLSLSSFYRLQSLEIFACRGVTSLWHANPPISKLSYDLAFKTIPNLEVTIGFDQNLISLEASQGLSSMTPYVTKFVHFNGY